MPEPWNLRKGKRRLPGMGFGRWKGARWDGKGQFSTTLIDFWSLIVLALIAVIFLILFNITKAEIHQEIKAGSGRINADAYFINFLRTPVEVKKGEYYTVMEIVPLAYSGDSEKRDALRKSAGGFMDTVNFELLPDDVCMAKIIVKSGKHDSGSMSEVDSFRLNRPQKSCGNPFSTYVVSAKVPASIGSSDDYTVEMDLYSSGGEAVRTP
jgi:hypothetical protein